MTLKTLKTMMLSLMLGFGLLGCETMALAPAIVQPDLTDDNPVIPQIDDNNDGVDIDDNTNDNNTLIVHFFFYFYS